MIKRLGCFSTAAVGLGQRIGLPQPVMTEQELEGLIAAKLEQLPFFVERTALGKGLPVYSDIKNGRTRHLTVVRRVYGDIHALANLLREKITAIKRIEVKETQQKIVLKGNVATEVKLLLTDLGF